MKQYKRETCCADKVVDLLGTIEKKYYGVNVVSITPAIDETSGDYYHIFFSYEDLRTNRCEHNEEDQE